MSLRGETLSRRLKARLEAPGAGHRLRLPPLPAGPVPAPLVLPRAVRLPLIGPLVRRLWAGLHTYRTLKARVAHLEALVAALAARDEALATQIAVLGQPSSETACGS